MITIKRTYICDHCKKEICFEGNEKAGSVNYPLPKDWKSYSYCSDDIHLCKECSNEYKFFMRFANKNDVCDLQFEGATLLSKEEAIVLLQGEEKTYRDWWWTRSYTSGTKEQRYVNSVYCSGDVTRRPVNFHKAAVRPALIITNLSKTNFHVGDYFEIFGYKFKILSKDLAFMINGDIGQSIFDEETSVYANSYIKHKVDEWYSNFNKAFQCRKNNRKKID